VVVAARGRSVHGAPLSELEDAWQAVKALPAKDATPATSDRTPTARTPSRRPVSIATAPVAIGPEDRGARGRQPIQHSRRRMTKEIAGPHTHHRAICGRTAFQQRRTRGRFAAMVTDLQYPDGRVRASGASRDSNSAPASARQPQFDTAEPHAEDDRIVIAHALAAPNSGTGGMQRVDSYRPGLESRA
jgi:hypothetical protein